MGFFDKLKKGLSKTREVLFAPIDRVFGAFSHVDEELFDELEEVMITADMGMPQTERILEQLRERVKREHLQEPEQAKEALIEILKDSICLLYTSPSPRDS